MSIIRILFGGLLSLAMPISLAHSDVEVSVIGKVDDSVRRKAAAANQFAADLFAQLPQLRRKQNVVISPHSLDTAVDMLALAAGGDTAKRLNASLSVGRTAATAAQLQKALMSAQGDAVTLKSANSLWLKKNATAQASYVAAMQSAFRAPLVSVDFADAGIAKRVNDWVSDNTQGMISQIVDRLDPLTEFVLANAIYFKGRWATPFDEAGTKPGMFARADGSSGMVPMMRGSQQLEYAMTARWHAVRIPYSGNRFAMVVVSSRGNKKNVNLSRALGSANMFKTIAGAAWQEREVNIALPRFRVEFGADLTAALSRRGLGHVFRGNANFSQMTRDPVKATSVFQATTVEITEDGTEAAAATAVVATRASSGPEPVDFTVDRPFVFFIVDQLTGTALFLGYIADPVGPGKVAGRDAH